MFDKNGDGIKGFAKFLTVVMWILDIVGCVFLWNLRDTTYYGTTYPFQPYVIFIGLGAFIAIYFMGMLIYGYGVLISSAVTQVEQNEKIIKLLENGKTEETQPENE